MVEAPTGLFKNRSFAVLITAQSISNLGDWLDILALFMLVALKWNVSPMQMGLVTLCMAGPMVLFGPIAGVIADRMERKTLMILSDVCRAFLVVGLVYVTSMWQVYLILILRGVLGAVFTPAKNGKIKEIVHDEQMEKATTVTTIIDQLAKIAGPVISGVLVGASGIQAAFWIDAATFIISALLLTGISRGNPGIFTKQEQIRSGFGRELKEGLQFVRKIPLLFYGTVLFCIVMLVLQVADSQIMILFRELPHVTTGLIGTAMAASGAGMILSAGVLSKKPNKSPLFAMAIGSALIGSVFAGVAILVQQWSAAVSYVIPVLFLLGGAAAGLVFIPFQAGAQKRTPVELSGRVFGTITSVVTSATIIGPIVGALLVTSLGVITAYILAGSTLAGIGIFAACGKNFIERRDESVAQGNGISQGTPAA